MGVFASVYLRCPCGGSAEIQVKPGVGTYSLRPGEPLAPVDKSDREILTLAAGEGAYCPDCGTRLHVVTETATTFRVGI